MLASWEDAKRQHREQFSPTARSQKEEERRRADQRHLRQIFDEENIDWNRFLEYQTKEGISPNFTDPSTLTTTLHMSAYANQVMVAQWCIHDGADIEARSAIGRTPLHMACDGDSVRCIRLLLEARAELNAVTLSMLTPLHLACRSGSYNAVTVLLGAPQIVDVNAADSNRLTADMLTKDRKIVKAIATYRSTMDCRRKQELLEHKLWRLFQIFDRDGSGKLNQTEWTKAQALLAGYFENACDEEIDMAFETIDTDQSQCISFEEFRDSQLEMMQICNSPHKQLMSNLSDIENRMFEAERPALRREATSQQRLHEISA